MEDVEDKIEILFKGLKRKAYRKGEQRLARMIVKMMKEETPYAYLILETIERMVNKKLEDLTCDHGALGCTDRKCPYYHQNEDLDWPDTKSDIDDLKDIKYDVEISPPDRYGLP